MERLYLSGFLLVALVAACTSGDPAQDRGKVSDSSSPEGTSFPGYEVIDVTGGGTIRGRILIEGEKPTLPRFDITANKEICAGAAENHRLEVGVDGGVRWGVVRLVNVKKGKEFPPLSAEGLTVDQVGCRYTPHVIAAPVGSEILFLNSDPTPHNVRVEDTAENVLMNVAQSRQGNRNTFLLKEGGPHSVGCDYHPWMNAYLFGVDNPYYGVTGPDGSFELNDIPPGEYELRMWLNGLKPIPQKDNQGALIRYRFEKPYEVVRRVTVQGGLVTEEMFPIRVQ